jgi:hypothetical protein
LCNIKRTDIPPVRKDANEIISKLAGWKNIDNTANRITAPTPAIALRHQVKLKRLGLNNKVVNMYPPVRRNNSRTNISRKF